VTGLYTIPLSQPFVDVLAAGLLARAGSETLQLPRTTILLPTSRACRALREAFLRAADGKPLLLPRMQALGDLDTDELTIHGADIRPAIAPLRRQALLARSLLKLGYSKTSAEAASVALALGRFLDEVETEEVTHEAVRSVVPDMYADHWQKILRFLTVLHEHWPAILEEEGALDAAQRRILTYDAAASLWAKEPPAHPVILAGSNGSIKALRRLMKVVAGLPKGEVILHGLDQVMDEAAWQDLDCSHPQHLLRVVLEEVGYERVNVPLWQGAQPNEAREFLIGEALLPPLATSRWHALHKNAFAPEALQGVMRLDCASPREEADAIALLMRETLEVPGRRAALVTPDRALARLVAASLERWGIAVDDSAGTKLSLTPPGSFLRLIATMMADDLSPYALLACFKHPLALGGLPPGAFRRRIRQLELAALRGPAPGPGFEGLIAALAPVEAEQRAELTAWLEQIAAWAAPFAAALKGATPVETLRAHIEFAEVLATPFEGQRGEELWKGVAGNALAEFVSEALLALEDFPVITDSYSAFFDTLLSTKTSRNPIGLHPRLFIWGVIEARLQHADLMILGGLNEDSWPEASTPDPFLSRPMRQALGLPAPEFQVGIAAHDFTAGLAAPNVVLTRSQRVGGVPTVPSRWLLRLDAVLEASGQSLTRSDDAATIMRLLDEAATVRPATRPQPKPPVSARPRRLTVSDVEAWLSDPYRLYARRVLGLKALDDIAAEPGAAERGTLIHTILERFADAHRRDLPSDALAALLKLGRELFDKESLAPAVEAFWWPRFARVAEWIIDLERARRAAGIYTAALEVTAKHEIQAPGGAVTLIAKADRIDILPDGSVEIIDYKTGSVPTEKDVKSGISPQLSLEAELARLGAFPNIQAAAAIASYWKLSGGTKRGEYKVFAGLPEMLERLAQRIAEYDDAAIPYLAVPPKASAARQGYHAKYEQLERLAEWAGGEEGEE
jgi:ATP-dependent helicase/nuclease subunit B